MSNGKIRIGIGGWTYEPWRNGVFYPAKWPQAKELNYAGEHLTAIEINGTFYGRQKPASFAKWRDAVPDDFVFTAKASRYCTNRKVLADATESIANFVQQGITELGAKLGPILWQLAATKQFDADDIEAFLALLPHEQDGLPLRHAIEPRHASFADPAFFALAREAKVAVVYAEAEAYPKFDEQTADFTYARIQTAREGLPNGYSDEDLDRLADQARQWAMGGRDVFLYFISGHKEKNPAAAMALIERLAG